MSALVAVTVTETTKHKRSDIITSPPLYRRLALQAATPSIPVLVARAVTEVGKRKPRDTVMCQAPIPPLVRREATPCMSVRSAVRITETTKRNRSGITLSPRQNYRLAPNLE